MAFWTIIACVAALLGFIFLFHASLDNWVYSEYILLTVSSFVISAMMFLCLFTMNMDYKVFENKLEMQREYYDSLSNDDENNNITLVIDALMINDELAKYKSSKMVYGIFSTVPDHFLELEPIVVVK